MRLLKSLHRVHTDVAAFLGGSAFTNRCYSFSAIAHSPPVALLSSDVILPHEELKIKLIRARQDKVAKLRSKGSSSNAYTTTEDGSLSHHDLASYMRVHRIKLNACKGDEIRTNALVTNYVHLGTRYEYLVQAHLAQQLGFSLTQVGGKGDGGVDLIGTWTVPKTTDLKPSGRPVTFKVYAQAKRFAPHRRITPSLIREVEGTLMSAPDSGMLKAAFADHLARVGPTQDAELSMDEAYDRDSLADTTTESDREELEDLGILVTTRPISDGIEKAMSSSRRCLMYIHLEEYPFQMPQKIGQVAQKATDQILDDQIDATAASGDNQGSPVETAPAWIPNTKIRQIVWNEAATRAGLMGYGVSVRHNSEATLDELGYGEAMLAYQGTVVWP